jgi:uncharacterized protein YrrD
MGMQASRLIIEKSAGLVVGLVDGRKAIRRNQLVSVGSRVGVVEILTDPKIRSTCVGVKHTASRDITFYELSQVSALERELVLV